jgi:hypothetical protein
MPNHSDKDAPLKDAIIAEYNSLRSQQIQRVRLQSNVIYWLIAIIGLFIGALASLKVLGNVSCQETTILYAIFNNPTKEVINVASLFSIIYIFVSELLISYWIYQSYHISVCNKRIEALSETYEKHFNIPKDIDILKGNFHLYQDLMAELMQPFLIYGAVSLAVLFLFFLTVQFHNWLICIPLIVEIIVLSLLSKKHCSVANKHPVSWLINLLKAKEL